MSLPGYKARVGDRTLAYTVFVRKPARGNFKDTFVDGNLLLKWMFKKYKEERGLVWFGSEWEQWQAVVDMVMNSVVPKNVGKSLII
jgi:hypothetical protein